MHMGTPPGYAAFYPTTGEIDAMRKESADYEWWKSLPPAVEAELREYYRSVQAGEIRDRTDDLVSEEDFKAAANALVHGSRVALDVLGTKVRKRGGQPTPCLWFDAEKRQCKHYEHRPETCRDAAKIALGAELEDVDPFQRAAITSPVCEPEKRPAASITYKPAIVTVLKEGPLTVAQIAHATGLDPDRPSAGSKQSCRSLITPRSRERDWNSVIGRVDHTYPAE